MSRFGPGRTTPLPLPAGITEDQVWLNDLKGVHMAKAVLERTVLKKT
jgi:hypothetical protein